MPDLIRHLMNAWIPAFSGMTLVVVFYYLSTNIVTLKGVYLLQQVLLSLDFK
jgi:hypothetical protein